MENKKIIVVLGSGRCGTSLLMQVLSCLNMTVSEDLIPPLAHNPLGPMEDSKIAKIYDDLLYKIGSNRVLPTSVDLLPNDIKISIQSKLIELARKNINSAKTIWGFKDPFTSFLIPLWTNIFNELSIIPIYILSVRNPIQSVRSRKKNFGIDESLGELAWLSNYVYALSYISADCFIVHYEDWFVRGEEVARELLFHTGLNKFEEIKIHHINEIIKPSLNRSFFENYRIKNKNVESLYNFLKNCYGDNFNRSGLMDIVQECRKDIEGFSGWYKEAQSALKFKVNHHRLNESLQRMKVNFNELEATNKNLKRKIVELETHLNKKKIKIKNLESNFLLIEKTVKKLTFKNEKTTESLAFTKESISFKLGNLIINAFFKKPGLSTLFLPIDILKLFCKRYFGPKIINFNSKKIDSPKKSKDENNQNNINIIFEKNCFSDETEKVFPGKNLKISIIIPVYNKEKYLPQCLDSISKLNDCEYEFICIDDCSSDESKKILTRYGLKDTRIKLIPLKQNHGAGFARNIGIVESTGDYLFFLDADDIISKDGLRKLIRVAVSDDCDFVRGKITGIKDNGERYILSGEHLLHDNDLHNLSWNDDESFWFYWYFSACLFKKDFLIKNFIQFPEGIRNEDPVFLCRCFINAKKISTISEIVYYYRIGDEQKNKTPTESFLTGWVNGYYNIFNLIKENKIPTQFFFIHFPSLVPHINNIIKTLDSEKSKKLLTKLHFIFKNSQHELFVDSNLQPWTKKKSFTWPHILYSYKLHDEDIDSIYDFFVNFNINDEKLKKNKFINNPQVKFKNENFYSDNELNPEISIIIPIFQTEKYIKQCLESVKKQTFKNFEVLCIDDFTQDDSIAIVNNFAKIDNRFRILKHSANLGLPESRNTGIKNSKGKFVFFLDSDDWIEPFALNFLYDLVIKDQVDIALGGVLKYDEDTGKKFHGNHAHYLEKDLNSITIFEEPKICNAVISCNKLIRKKFIEDTGLYFFSEPRRFEDILTYMWFLCGAKISLTTKVTYIYRQRSKVCNNKSIMQSDDLLIYRDKFLAFSKLIEFQNKLNFGENFYKGYNINRMLSWVIPKIQIELNSKGIDPLIRNSVILAFKKLCSSLTAAQINSFPIEIQNVIIANAK